MPVSLRKAVVFFAFLAVVGANSGLNAQGDPKAALIQNLKQTFQPTRFSANRSDVVTAGSAVVLHKDNLLLYTVAVPNPPRSTYKNEKLSVGFGDAMAVDMADGLAYPGGATAIPRKTLGDGEKFWVSDIGIAANCIIFRLVTEPYDDGRYYADLKFPIGKGTIPSADDAQKMVSEVLTLDQSDAQQAQGAVQLPPSSAGASQGTEPPLPPLVPPPPPTDAPPPTPVAPVAPKTISLGQTKDQVIANFGQPQKVVHLGPKEIDFYADLKVTLVNGKVTDVQ